MARRNRAIEITHLVKRDHAALAGKEVLLRAVSGHDAKGEPVEITLDPPLPFKVSAAAPEGELFRVCAAWIDPTYDVEPVNPRDPQIADLTSFFCYGVSYHLYEKESEDGDVVVPSDLLRFRVPYRYAVTGTVVVRARDPAAAAAIVQGSTAQEFAANAVNSEVTQGPPELWP